MAKLPWFCGSVLMSLLVSLAGVEIPTGYVISGTRQVVRQTQAGRVSALDYSDTDDVLFLSGESGNVNFIRGTEDTLFSGGTAGAPVTAIVYLPQLDVTVLGREDGLLRFLQGQLGGVIGDVQENAELGVVTDLTGLEYSDDIRSYDEVASASLDGSVKIWDSATRTQMRVLEGHTLAVLCLCFLAGPEVLVSGGLDGFLGFWSMPRATFVANNRRCTGQKQFLGTAEHERSCLQVAIEGGATYFIYGLPDTSTSRVCEKELGDCTETQQADYSLYRIEDPLIQMVPAHGGSVAALAPVPDLNAAASGGSDGTIKLWDVGNATWIRDMATDPGLGSAPGVLALEYITSLRVLVASTAVGFSYYDVATGDMLKHIPLSAEAPALSHISKHGFLAVAQLADVELWNIIERCVDGRYPVSPATCELCPRDRAGSLGTCQVQCLSGNWSSEDRTRCEQCPGGRAGTDGNCLQCQPGRFQDVPGNTACEPCGTGRAQSLQGQVSCVPCVDNTAATTDGLAACEECPFGTEPSADHKRCTSCPQGKAGIRGTCFQCNDGEEPNANLSSCIPCTGAMAGSGGICAVCADGSTPAPGRVTCEACPLAYAGTGGYCERCEDGQTPAPSKAFCQGCPTGEAGGNGTCSVCPPGSTPDATRTLCEACPRGAAAAEGVCNSCADGSTPAEDLASCSPCPAGQAGTGGVCSTCPGGFGPSTDRSTCVPCPDTHASNVGVCFQCPSGTMPNETSQQNCQPCPQGRAGTFGQCLQCGDGTQQEPELRTTCNPCPLGSAGRGGTCEECPHPLMQDPLKAECNLQVLPSYHAFRYPRCYDHPNCSNHFQHLPSLEDGSLFCCPTPSGELLACCGLATAPDCGSSALVDLGTSGLDAATGLSESLWPLLVLGLLPLLVGLCCCLRRVEDWDEVRERYSLSTVAAALSPLLFGVILMILPWLVITGLILGWLPFFTVLLVGLLSQLFRRWTHGSHASRKEAASRMRPLFLLAAFMSNWLLTLVELLQEVMLARYLLADFSGSLEVFIGFALVKHYPMEHAAELTPLGLAMRPLLAPVMSTFAHPQVALGNLVICVDYGATRFTTTLLAGAAGSLALSSCTYVLLVCDIPGRLAATKESVHLSAGPLWWWALRLSLLHHMDAALNMLLLWAAIVPSRMLFLLLQLRTRWPAPEGIFALYAENSLMLFALAVQATMCFMWAGVAAGSHIQDPPAWLARRITSWTGMEFEAHRREQFLVKAVLSALGLLSNAETKSSHGQSSPRAAGSSAPARPAGSPRTSSSPRGKSHQKQALKNIQSVKRMLKMHAETSPRPAEGRLPSPRGSVDSPRGAQFNQRASRGSRGSRGSRSASRLHQSGTGISARAMSPRAMSPRVKSPRAMSPRAMSPRAMSPTKGRTFGLSGRSYRSGSPRERSPRSPGSPRDAADTGGRRLKFIRLVDGSHAELGRKRLTNGIITRIGHLKQATTLALSPRGQSPRSRAGEPNTARTSLSGSVSNMFARSPRLASRVSNRSTSPRTAPVQTDWFEVMALQEWGDKRVEDLKMTPQQLYSRVLPPQVRFSCRGFCLGLLSAIRASICCTLGLWRARWNVLPHGVRRRTRDLTREASRKHYDQEDYAAMVRATSRTLALALLWLPLGGAFLASLTGCLNHPPLRHCDSSLDIGTHKKEEYLEQGMTPKEVEFLIKKMVVYKQEHKTRRIQTRVLEGIQRLINLVVVAILIFFEAVISSATAEYGPSLLSTLVLMTAIHALIDSVFLPVTRLTHGIHINVNRDVPEEKAIKEQVAAAVIQSESESVTPVTSSDYSSGNESYMDENPRKERKSRRVFGVRMDKVIVRPKACRLHARFQLMRGVPECRQFADRWQREEPERHGRLLRVEGAFGGMFNEARKRSQTVTFKPTQGSDWLWKAEEHKLRRSRSLGQQTAEERLELRVQQERWQGTDVCKEAAVPRVPAGAGSMRPRGIIDEFEALGVFKQHTHELTNAQLCCAAPWQDTACVQGVQRAFNPEAVILPWEAELDEALEERDHHPQLVEMEDTGHKAEAVRGTSMWSRRVDAKAR